AVFLSAILFINLLAAHTRALIGEPYKLDAAQAFQKSVEVFSRSPFGVTSFEAWILFIVGLLIALFAIERGYTFDDPYPGYGDEDRHKEKAIQMYVDAKQSFISDITLQITSIEDAFRSALQRVKRDINEHDAILAQSTNLLESYQEYIRHLN